MGLTGVMSHFLGPTLNHTVPRGWSPSDATKSSPRWWHPRHKLHRRRLVVGWCGLDNVGSAILLGRFSRSIFVFAWKRCGYSWKLLNLEVVVFFFEGLWDWNSKGILNWFPEKIYHWPNVDPFLGGGFKYFLCSPLFGGNDPFWLIFFN